MVASNWRIADSDTVDYCKTVARLIKQRHALLSKAGVDPPKQKKSVTMPRTQRMIEPKDEDEGVNTIDLQQDISSCHQSMTMMPSIDPNIANILKLRYQAFLMSSNATMHHIPPDSITMLCAECIDDNQYQDVFSSSSENMTPQSSAPESITMLCAECSPDNQYQDAFSSTSDLTPQSSPGITDNQYHDVFSWTNGHHEPNLASDHLYNSSLGFRNTVLNGYVLGNRK